MTGPLVRAVLAGLVLAGCGGASGGGEAATTVAPDGLALPTVTVTVTTPDGRVCELCVWLAATAEERARGLMGVTDLGAVDGMAFTYPAPAQGAFWMRSTPVPLAISFHDRAGDQVGWHEMDPCPDEVPASACPRYGADAPYVLALEVPAARAVELGVEPGSNAELGGPCQPG